MDRIKDSLMLLGYQMRDRVTGFKGVVTSVSFDLYSYTQALVHPGLDKDGVMREQVWFDINRLEYIEEFNKTKGVFCKMNPVMEQNFINCSSVYDKGPENKPIPKI